MIAGLIQRLGVLIETGVPRGDARRLQVAVKLGAQFALGGKKAHRQFKDLAVRTFHGVAPLVVDGVVVATAKGSNAANHSPEPRNG